MMASAISLIGLKLPAKTKRTRRPVLSSILIPQAADLHRLADPNR
ncbi:hypothetical protein [Mesorhizobium sp. B2-4-13]|nr:hypothetical protein [Mesorhizobium sp. B2-4-13]